jgi:hypothetical protein
VTEQEFKGLLLPADWTTDELEAEARRIYFQDLVPNPPETPEFPGLEKQPLLVGGTEGSFQKVFGKPKDGHRTNTAGRGSWTWNDCGAQHGFGRSSKCKHRRR